MEVGEEDVRQRQELQGIEVPAIAMQSLEVSAEAGGHGTRLEAGRAELRLHCRPELGLQLRSEGGDVLNTLGNECAQLVCRDGEAMGGAIQGAPRSDRKDIPA
jgi:hypothetical protein